VLDILKELNSTPGVRGSTVVMGDGVVMASLHSAGCDADSFAALISSLFSNVMKSAGKLGLGAVRRMLVSSSRGCFSAIYLGNAWLVAELELEIEPATVELEIESAAGRLRRQLRVRGPEAPAPFPSESAHASEPRTQLKPPAPKEKSQAPVAEGGAADSVKSHTPLVS
jgi:predicted regulator of Ras-like GTPase activity (Roadblock/LC7/MglB family)